MMEKFQRTSTDFRPLLKDGDISEASRHAGVSLGLANIVAKGYYDPISPTDKQKRVIAYFEMMIQARETYYALHGYCTQG